MFMYKCVGCGKKISTRNQDGVCRACVSGDDDFDLDELKREVTHYGDNA